MSATVRLRWYRAAPSGAVTIDGGIGAAVAAGLGAGVAGDLASLPLLYESNISTEPRYLGAFKVPYGDSFADSFSNPDCAIAYNPANNSLVMSGRLVEARVTEVSIPAVGDLDKTGVVANMPEATFLVPSPRFFPVYPGATSPYVANDGFVVGTGVAVHNGAIYHAFQAWYADGTEANIAGQYKKSSANLSSGTNTGPFSWALSNIGGEPRTQRWFAGSWAEIPAEWQSALGGPMLVGMHQRSINSGQSCGPSAAVFNPADIGTVNPIPNTPLVGYPLAYKLDNHDPSPSGEWPDGGQFSSLWTIPDTSAVGGMAFVPGTRSLLFFGRKGVGPQYYKPPWGGAGYDASPYRFAVWAYDALDLKRVRDNEVGPHQIFPYANWVFKTPPGIDYRGDTEYGGDASGTLFGLHQPFTYAGAAFDPTTRRVYLTENATVRWNTTSIVHVFQLTIPT